jgi:signal transduction histidine kinase
MPNVAGDFYSPSLDLVMLIIALGGNFFLAYAVLESDRKSATNRIFAILALFTSLWLIDTNIVRIPATFAHTLLLHRLGIFFAAPMSTFFFLLAYTFPHSKLKMKLQWAVATISGTILMMLFNISPYAFTGIVSSGGVANPTPGLGLLPFSVISTLFSLLAPYLLMRKYFQAKGIERTQLALVVAGLVSMLVLIITTLLLPIILFNSVAFLPFTPLYTLFFLGLTAYAIIKYQLFNIKVLLTQALTIVISVVLFAKLFGDDTANARLIDGLVFIFALYFGHLLVGSVRKEVLQRETIEKQEQELESVNARQENLLHFISHEIKGYLTKGQNAFAGIVEGDYGAVSEPVKELAQGALGEMRKGVSTVMDILDASNLKKGTMTFQKNRFDLKKHIEKIAEDIKWAALRKGIKVQTNFEASDTYEILGDEEKISRHVLRNLVDNSLKYTPSGSISLSLSRAGNMIRFTVSDTGVGITPEDMRHLFTEGGHGKDSIKVNVDSTGYGLFVAKQVTDAHAGKISAFSKGEGKGSTFTVDLPAAQ